MRRWKVRPSEGILQDRVSVILHGIGRRRFENGRPSRCARETLPLRHGERSRLYIQGLLRWRS